MKFSEISLTRQELRTLRKLSTGPLTVTDQNRAALLRLYRLNLAKSAFNPDFSAPRDMCISDAGVDYLAYRRSSLSRSILLPVGVSLLTNLALEILRLLLPVLKQWLLLLLQ